MQNESQIMNTSEKQEVSKSKSFEDFIIILVKWRKIIFWNTLIITLAAVIISLLMDKWYTSTASILPPKKKGGLFGDIAGFSSTIKDLSKTLGRLGATSDEAFNYLAIMQSRTASIKVIDKFNLRKVYKIEKDKPIEAVIDELKNNVNFNVEDEGTVTINVSDKNPKRAADMANYYVEILNEISIELSTREAKNNREFIERRYNQVLVDIKDIEDSLKIFSQKFNIYGIEEQTKVAIKSAADLKAQVEAKQIELDIYKLNQEDTHPLIIQTKLQLEELQKKLKDLQSSDEITKSGFFIPFKKIPEVGIKYVRLMRDYEVQTRLMEFILPIYEQAKIEEQKEIPVVLVLDKGMPAERKSAPKRAIIVLAAFLISLLLGVSYVLILESFQNLKNEETRYQTFRNGIIIPLKHFFKSNK
jgi:uncharacterized protein involved in exopolysaccharide biosynthesis